MSRIAARFEKLKSEGRKGFIPFLTAGDPELDISLAIALRLAERADVIELGVPFSDPMADGPVIQRSSQRAVDNGTSLKDVIRLASQIRQRSDVPVVLFSYYNPVLSFGLEDFFHAAADAGVDGIILTDVIDEEALTISLELAAFGIDLISLVSPTTTDERLTNICQHARGFIYAVSRNGTTGQQETSSASAATLVKRVRPRTDLPVAVGFGISTREQITDVWEFADAAVVGSAIVAEIERAPNRSDVISRVDSLLEGLLPGVAKTGAEN
jgi:tryptophan synthase alpha chain